MSFFELIGKAALGAVIGGALSLDTVAAGQFLLSSPLVACPLLGWILGNPWLGITIGMALALPWLGTLPVGAYTPPDAPCAAMTVTIASILFSSVHPQLPALFVASVAILPAPLLATLAGFGDNLVYHCNERTVKQAERAYLAGNRCAPAQAVLRGLAGFYLKGLGMILIGGLLCWGWLELVALLPPAFYPLAACFYFAILGLGVGTIISSAKRANVILSTITGLVCGLGLAYLTGGVLW